MSEFKVGDKVLVECEMTEADEATGQYFVESDVDCMWATKVRPYTDKTYDDGIEEAWDTAIKLANMGSGEASELFDEWDFVEITEKHGFTEINNKIREWEEAKAIHVGDVVDDGNRHGFFGAVVKVVDCGVFVLWADGSTAYISYNDMNLCPKTGRTVDVVGLLKQIVGDGNE